MYIYNFIQSYTGLSSLPCAILTFHPSYIIIFSTTGVRRPPGISRPVAIRLPCPGKLDSWWSLISVSPAPYIRYCTPKNASQHAWNMPESLNAHGMDEEDVKNQNIFMASPKSQLARTENRNPLQDRERAFVRICGRGRVASMARPT